MKNTIKLTIALILGSVISVYAVSRNVSEGSGKYCAKMQNGKRVVMHLGTPITANVTLNDGTVVKPDGVVTKRDGKSMILMSGQCVNEDGTLCSERRREKEKKAK